MISLCKGFCEDMALKTIISISICTSDKLITFTLKTNKPNPKNLTFTKFL